jgi:hypothetical protein
MVGHFISPSMQARRVIIIIIILKIYNYPVSCKINGPLNCHVLHHSNTARPGETKPSA